VSRRGEVDQGADVGDRLQAIDQLDQALAARFVQGHGAACPVAAELHEMDTWPMRRTLLVAGWLLPLSLASAWAAGPPVPETEIPVIEREAEPSPAEVFRRLREQPPGTPSPPRHVAGPELAALVGTPISDLLAPARVRRIVVPFTSRHLTDALIRRHLQEGRVVDPDRLTPLHLRPCARLTAWLSDGRSSELCLFETADGRGLITLADRTTLWFATTAP
jgi:hypothetical protein